MCCEVCINSCNFDPQPSFEKPQSILHLKLQLFCIQANCFGFESQWKVVYKVKTRINPCNSKPIVDRMLKQNSCKWRELSKQQNNNIVVWVHLKIKESFNNTHFIPKYPGILYSFVFVWIDFAELFLSTFSIFYSEHTYVQKCHN